MRPTSLSATALQVADLCMARYQAEHITRGRAPTGKEAATLGSAVHGALELYVKSAVMDGATAQSQQHLLELFRMSYMTEFNTSDTNTDEYADGVEMLKGWHKRTTFEGVTVLSCEIKENFPIPTSLGDIPFNYIWDRFDQLEPGVLRVVDYKTNRWAISPDDLKKKVQARCYGLAAAIKAKQLGLEVDRIWVEFDLLRHTNVGTVFTREENAATWKFIKDTAERIINTPDDEAEETPNSECNFCVRKVSCNALMSNAHAGGIFGLSFAQIVDKRAQLNWQATAIQRAITECDTFIETEARAADLTEFETDLTKLTFSVSKRRAVDGERVARIVGNDIFQRYGGMKIGIGDLEKKLFNDPEVTDEMKTQIRQMIFTSYGEARVRTEARNPIDEA